LRQARAAARHTGARAHRRAARSRIDRGLRLGADDYVSKPFSPIEVVLRVPGGVGPPRATARREDDRRLTAAAELADRPGPPRGVAGRRASELTATEWGLLPALASVPAGSYSGGMNFVGQPGARVRVLRHERTIDSHIKNLRHTSGRAGGEVVRDGARGRYRWDSTVTGDPRALVRGSGPRPRLGPLVGGCCGSPWSPWPPGAAGGRGDRGADQGSAQARQSDRQAWPPGWPTPRAQPYAATGGWTGADLSAGVRRARTAAGRH